MSGTSRDRALLARNSVRSLLFLYLAASALAVVGWHVNAVTTSLWHWYLTLVVSGTLALIISVRRNIPVAVSNTCFLLVTAVLMFCVSRQTYEVAAVGRWSAVAFSGYKLIAIAVAIVALTPEWSAYLVIGLCAVIPTIQTLIASPDIHRNYPRAEPWVSVIYAMVAFFVLRHRFRGIALERKLSQLEAERQSIDHLARIFLGLRDLTNSPLQSIELTAWMLRKGHLTTTEAAQYLESSLVRLHEMNLILKTYEKEIDWSREAHSFNALQLLQQKLAGMKRSE